MVFAVVRERPKKHEQIGGLSFFVRVPGYCGNVI